MCSSVTSLDPVRAVIPVVAGMFAMKQLPFQIANVVSAFMWAAGVIAPSFFLVANKDAVFAFLLQYENIVALVMFAAAFLECNADAAARCADAVDFHLVLAPRTCLRAEV